RVAFVDPPARTPPPPAAGRTRPGPPGCSPPPPANPPVNRLLPSLPRPHQGPPPPRPACRKIETFCRKIWIKFWLEGVTVGVAYRGSGFGESVARASRRCLHV